MLKGFKGCLVRINTDKQVVSKGWKWFGAEYSKGTKPKTLYSPGRYSRRGQTTPTMGSTPKTRPPLMSPPDPGGALLIADSRYQVSDRSGIER